MDGKDGRSVRERMGIWKGGFSRAPGMGSLISSAIEGIIFKKILIERLQGKGEERNRYSAQLCSMIKRSKVGRKEDRFDGMAR